MKPGSGGADAGGGVCAWLGATVNNDRHKENAVAAKTPALTDAPYPSRAAILARRQRHLQLGRRLGAALKFFAEFAKRSTVRARRCVRRRHAHHRAPALPRPAPSARIVGTADRAAVIGEARSSRQPSGTVSSSGDRRDPPHCACARPVVHLAGRAFLESGRQGARPRPFTAPPRAAGLCSRPEFAMFSIGQHCCPNCWWPVRAPLLACPVHRAGKSGARCAGASRRRRGRVGRRHKAAEAGKRHEGCPQNECLALARRSDGRREERICGTWCGPFGRRRGARG